MRKVRLTATLVSEITLIAVASLTFILAAAYYETDNTSYPYEQPSPRASVAPTPLLMTTPTSAMTSPSPPQTSPSTAGGSFGPLGNFGITSPSNITYSSDTVSLNVTGQVIVGTNVELLMTYSLDGQENLPFPVVINQAHAGDHFIGVVTGSVTLSKLSYGSHSVTVFGDLEANGPHQSQTTVYFSVRLTTSP